MYKNLQYFVALISYFSAVICASHAQGEGGFTAKSKGLLENKDSPFYRRVAGLFNELQLFSRNLDPIVISYLQTDWESNATPLATLPNHFGHGLRFDDYKLYFPAKDAKGGLFIAAVPLNEALKDFKLPEAPKEVLLYKICKEYSLIVSIKELVVHWAGPKSKIDHIPHDLEVRFLGAFLIAGMAPTGRLLLYSPVLREDENVILFDLKESRKGPTKKIRKALDKLQMNQQGTLVAYYNEGKLYIEAFTSENNLVEVLPLSSKEACPCGMYGPMYTFVDEHTLVFANDSSFRVYTVDAERKFYTFKDFESGATKFRLIEHPGSLNTFGLVSNPDVPSQWNGIGETKLRGRLIPVFLNISRLNFAGTVCEGIVIGSGSFTPHRIVWSSPTGFTVAVETWITTRDALRMEKWVSFYQIAGHPKPSIKADTTGDDIKYLLDDSLSAPEEEPSIAEENGKVYFNSLDHEEKLELAPVLVLEEAKKSKERRAASEEHKGRDQKRIGRRVSVQSDQSKPLGSLETVGGKKGLFYVVCCFVVLFVARAVAYTARYPNYDYVNTN